MNLFKEQIKTPWPVILQTLLNHKQLGLQQGQTQQIKQTPAQYFVMSSFISTPRGAEKVERKHIWRVVLILVLLWVTSEFLFYQ